MPTIQDDENKSVAVYARVSTKSTEQVSSIENQTKYYTEKIEKTSNWEMQEIYSDAGISGGKGEPPGLMAMMEQASHETFLFSRGNHKHVPSDIRVINSLQHVNILWICI